MTKGNKTIKVIDLFAGVGGFRVGLEQRSNNYIGSKAYEFVWGNQWEPGVKTQHAADIYKDRFGADDEKFVNEDINNVKTMDIPDHDLVCAGFPCQDYSVATTKKLSGGINGKKGVLWWQIERILREKGESRPDFLLLENVDRLLSSPASQRGRDFAIMLTCLNQLGYMVEWRVVDASQYGFPQRRKRVFFLGYREGTKPYKSFNDPVDWLENDGVFAKAFPLSLKGNLNVFDIPSRVGSQKKYTNNLRIVTKEFGKGTRTTQFNKTGIMFNGKIHTSNYESKYDGETKVLGDVIIPEQDVPDEYFIDEADKEKWEYLKGAKKEKRITKDGFEYNYSEGAVTYPDDLNKPSRTVITGEGGQTPSRFKHVIRTKSGKLRRLTPLELERLNMFPDGHTAGCTDSRRAFLMGNALVVGVVTQIGNILYENI